MSLVAQFLQALSHSSLEALCWSDLQPQVFFCFVPRTEAYRPAGILRRGSVFVGGRREVERYAEVACGGVKLAFR